MLDLFLHIDEHLTALTHEYGLWVYLILFVIVFCETGLVVTPLLPGDSLLFAAGALAAAGALDLPILLVLLIIAAILGDSVNYFFGYNIGPKIFRSEKGLFFNKAYLDRASAFYERHGKMTIVLARFLPIIRTFAPFVAGIGKMQYGQFLFFNIVGGIIWVVLFTGAGFIFGNLPAVRDNFTIAILAIIILSIIPTIIEFVRHKVKRKGNP